MKETAYSPVLPFPLQDSLSRFWFISRCWNDYQLAKDHGVSVERAIKELRQVQECARGQGGKVLARRAKALLDEIVLKQEQPKSQSVQSCAPRP